MVQGTSKISPNEVILIFDRELAKHHLIIRLSEIPEFVELWAKARRVPTTVMEAVKPKMRDLLVACLLTGVVRLPPLDWDPRLSYTTKALGRKQWIR